MDLPKLVQSTGTQQRQSSCHIRTETWQIGRVYPTSRLGTKGQRERHEFISCTRYQHYKNACKICNLIARFIVDSIILPTP